MMSLISRTVGKITNATRRDRIGTEVFPINNSRKKLKYGFVTYEQYEAGQMAENIKVGDNISIIEEKYVVKGGPDDEKFYSIDDTKFKTGTVKSIVPEGAPWADEDGRGEHQKIKIVLTNIDSAKKILKDKVINNVFSTIGEFSEEHIVIDALYEPSHYYSRGIVSGRRQKRKQTRKSSKSKLKRKTSKSNVKRKTSKSNVKRKKGTKGNK